jgi:hypothetical protein
MRSSPGTSGTETAQSTQPAQDSQIDLPNGGGSQRYPKKIRFAGKPPITYFGMVSPLFGQKKATRRVGHAESSAKGNVAIAIAFRARAILRR